MSSIARGTWRWDSRLEVSFPYSPEVISAIKAQIDPRDREWSPSTKTWIFTAPLGSTVALQLLRSYFHNVEVTDSRDTYQSPPPPPFFEAEPNVDPDCARLYIMPTAPRFVVDAVFKAFAREYHPDRLPAGEKQQGHERMVVINAAYERVRERVAS